MLTLTCCIWASAHEYTHCKHTCSSSSPSLSFPSLSLFPFSLAYVSSSSSSSSTCPCLNESRGALFLALCHHPRGPCLSLALFLMHALHDGKLVAPTLHIYSHIHDALHSLMAVTCAEGELGYIDGWNCTNNSLSLLVSVAFDWHARLHCDTFKNNWCI